jgi:hypothetical protein
MVTPQSSPTARAAVDARDIITEDSFRIDRRLLGLPLARPWRRACAMSVDGVLVVLLANTPGFLLAMAVAIVLFRASAPARKIGFVRRSIRMMLRFTAAFILFALVVSGWGRLSDGTRGAAETLGLGSPAASRYEPPAPPGTVTADGETPDGEAAATPVEPERSTDSLALAYAAAVEAGDDRAVVELRERLATAAAADEADALRSELESRERRIGQLNRELEDAREGPGIVAMLGRFAEDLGIGFGWAGLYFTAFVALWNGRTPGKRLMRVRVIRLDGKPVGWWMAFERFGGYAASFVTGLLGFIQILWDRNRQAMHDKITETVVVLE